jgi:hypothetical protein
MASNTIESGSAVNLTATNNICPVSADLLGFYVNSTTAGTVVLRDGGSGGTVLTGTITPAVGFHRFPASCRGIPHATIGGTLDVTFFFVPTRSA